MVKIYTPQKRLLNLDMLKENFELVEDASDADIILSCSTVLFPEYLDKTIYISHEPPLSKSRLWNYGHFDDFLAVFCYNPDPSKKNQFPLNSDGVYQYFPANINTSMFITREDTSLKNRGVFFAGQVEAYMDGVGSFGGLNIVPLRKYIGEYLMKEFPKSKFIGIGWSGQKSKQKDWYVGKQQEIAKNDCDFVLALENTVYPNYISEKLGDGFVSDRVTLYLGDPNIEKHVPTNCFIDLREYFNKDTKEFDLEGLGKRIREMTQEEYDEILSNARKYRETYLGRYRYHRDKLTREVIDFIKNGK